MKICTCESCHYTFRYPLVPQNCPDCGKQAVRKAAPSEIIDYRKNQRILAEEIRRGLYSTAG